MRKKRDRVFLAALVLAGILGCNPIDGTDPYALWSTYTQPDGLFHFHYLSPPWEKQTTTSTAEQRFVVDVDGIPLANQGLPGDGMDARLIMIVKIYQGIPALAAAWSNVGYWIDKGANVGQLEAFHSEMGEEGVRIRAEGTDRFFTTVFHDLPEWGAVSMTVVGKENVDSSDIELLLESLEPTPASIRGLWF